MAIRKAMAEIRRTVKNLEPIAAIIDRVMHQQQEMTKGYFHWKKVQAYRKELDRLRQSALQAREFVRQAKLARGR